MKKLLIAATLVLSLGAGTASADTVWIDSIVDGWENPSGGLFVNIDNDPNPGTDTIRWGWPTGFGGQSGYDWNSSNVPFSVQTGSIFSLGQFTHHNNPIFANTSITSVDLSFDVGNFEAPSNLNATFTFWHDETPNQSPCGFPSSSTCDDFVEITGAFFDAPIIDNGGKHYYFTLLGFSTDGGETTSLQFQTKENKANKAKLYAVITEAPIGVPDGGATLALLGGALLGLGALRRRVGL